MASRPMSCEVFKFRGRHTYRFTPATSISMTVDRLPMREHGDILGGQSGL